jgi:hypothetical protein
MNSAVEQAHPSSLRPEVELLLCCARTRMDAERGARTTALLQKPLDWEYLIRLAKRHALVSLLYWQIKALNSESIPASYLDQLRESFQQNTARNLFLTAELCKILRLFAEHSIAAIPYKGPTLAVEAYKDAALRMYGDLDILLHQQDIPKATELLLGREYQSPFKISSAHDVSYINANIRESCELPLARDQGRIYVEIGRAHV